MQKLSLAKGIYQQYKTTVEGNEETTVQQAGLKMTRNMQLAHESKRPDGSSHYRYGCLHFIVANDTVVWMQNNCKPQKNWKRNNKLYLKLNKELGIKENVTMIDLVVRDIKASMKYRMNKLKWKIKLKLNPANN